MIDGQTFFYHPVRNKLITQDSIWNISTDQGAGCLMDYNYLKNL